MRLSVIGVGLAALMMAGSAVHAAGYGSLIFYQSGVAASDGGDGWVDLNIQTDAPGTFASRLVSDDQALDVRPQAYERTLTYTVVFDQPGQNLSPDENMMINYDEIDYRYTGSGPDYGGFVQEVGGSGPFLYPLTTIAQKGNTVVSQIQVDVFSYSDGYSGIHHVGDVLSHEYSAPGTYQNLPIYGPDAVGQPWSLALYVSGVPEPSSWVLMATSFAAAGAALRGARRRLLRA